MHWSTVPGGWSLSECCFQTFTCMMRGSSHALTGVVTGGQVVPRQMKLQRRTVEHFDFNSKCRGNIYPSRRTWRAFPTSSISSNYRINIEYNISRSGPVFLAACFVPCLCGTLRLSLVSRRWLRRRRLHQQLYQNAKVNGAFTTLVTQVNG